VGGRHPDPEIRGPGLEKEFFRPFSPQFGPKRRGGPSLDPPLIISQNFLTTGHLYFPGCPASNRGSKGERCPDRNEEWKT